MLSREQVEQFNRDGYLKSGKVLNDDQVTHLQNEIERVIRDQSREDTKQPVLCRDISKDPSSPVWQIVNIWNASEGFRKLMMHPTIAEELSQLTQASELRIWHDQVQFKPASRGGVNMWHQDAPYWPIIRPMTEVSAWVALDDVDAENGCMSMVPGSHLWGNHISFLHTLKNFTDMPTEFEGRNIEVRLCPVRKGEVHYHHALTWHGSQANTSNRPRRAVALHYMTGDTRYVADGEHPMKPYVTVANGELIKGDAFPRVWPVEK